MAGSTSSKNSILSQIKAIKLFTPLHFSLAVNSARVWLCSKHKRDCECDSRALLCFAVCTVEKGRENKAHERVRIYVVICCTTEHIFLN